MPQQAQENEILDGGEKVTIMVMKKTAKMRQLQSNNLYQVREDNA